MAQISQMTDEELISWMSNVITVASVVPTQYGVSAAQITELTAARDDLKNKVSARNTAEDAFRASVTAQRTSRKSNEPLASYIYQNVKINPDVPNNDKEAIGVQPNKPPTKTPPVRPDGLEVNGFEDGRNVLKWKRSGNKQNTQFIIEEKPESELIFKYLATTTETKYTQYGAKPGRRTAYRVKAQRSGEESTYSNEAIVY